MTPCAWIILFSPKNILSLSFPFHLRMYLLIICLNVSDNVVIEVSNVALSSCSVELMSQPCRNNVCAQGTVTLSAVTDFTRDGNRASFLSTQPTEGSHRLWRGYNPPALKVSETLACISQCNISCLSGFVLNIFNLIRQTQSSLWNALQDNEALEITIYLHW